MGSLKLHGSVECIGTQRVMAALFESNAKFEFLPVHPEAMQTPHFLSLSPFGEIPFLQDGDLTLFESRAEMRYISFEYGTDGIVKESGRQGVVASWIDVEKHQFEEPVVRLIQGLLSGNEVEVDKEERRLCRVLDVYETRLTASKFLGCDEFTSADLTHMPYLHALMQSRRGKTLLLQNRPKVATWCTNLLSRPSWAQVLQMTAIYSKSD